MSWVKVTLSFSVAAAPSCKKIIIVWQDQNKPRPTIHDLPRVRVPVIVKKTQRNVLSNRFIPYDDIQVSVQS